MQMLPFMITHYKVILGFTDADVAICVFSEYIGETVSVDT